MELFNGLQLGWEVASSYDALLYCLFGVTLGMLVGVIPGIGVLAAISLLLPLTFGMNEVHAIIMLAGCIMAPAMAAQQHQSC
jgi:putative tricarboxylic transport membrane protein